MQGQLYVALLERGAFFPSAVYGQIGVIVSTYRPHLVILLQVRRRDPTSVSATTFQKLIVQFMPRVAFMATTPLYGRVPL